MRKKMLMTSLLLLFSGWLAAQSGQDLFQQGLVREQLGDYGAAIRIYERIIRDFAKDRTLVAKTKLRLGDSWTKQGDAKGLDYLNDVIKNYKDQADLAAEAKRLAARNTSTSRRPMWTEHDFMLVAEFENRTGNPIFENSLTAGLSFQLAQSPYVDVFPYSRVRETLTRLRRQPNERVTHTVAQEICEKAGVKGSLLPSIEGGEGRYVIALEVVSCSPAAELIARAQVEAASYTEVLSQLGKAASSVRAALGEPMESLLKFDALRAITTNSLEALDAYAEGYKYWVEGELVLVIEALSRAVKLDPNFASAYSLMVTGVDSERDRLNAAEAFRLRDPVSERERLSIEARYQATVLGDIEKTIDTLEHLRDLYPRDAAVRSFLSDQYRTKGLFDLGLKELLAAVELDPTNSLTWERLISAYMELGRFDDAQSAYKQARERAPDSNVRTHAALYSLAFVNRDAEAIEEQVRWLNDPAGITLRSVARDGKYFLQAQAAAYYGRLSEAQQFREEMQQAPYNQNPARSSQRAHPLAIEATTRALFGDFHEVPGLLEEAFRLSRVPSRMTLAAVAFGLAGDEESVKMLVDEIRTKYPEDTVMNRIWTAAALAALEIRKSNGAVALKLLEPAKAYEPGASSLWTVYLRGLAYLQTESGREAAAEFQKILDHPGVDPMSPLHPLALFRRAEAYALAGDLSRARESYQDFFTLWKDADSDIPVFREAKAKYAALPAN